MQFFWTPTFKKDFKRLPESIRSILPDVLRRFAENSHYPSLRVKKMEGQEDIWEMRLSGSYRLTFQFVREGVLLRRVGTHNVLRTP